MRVIWKNILTKQIAAGLRELGRDVELIIHEDEGHQTTKLANKVTAYGAMTRFLARRLDDSPSSHPDE